MDGALGRGTTLVEAYRGRVLRYAGDNLLAVFGADEAHEDDAELAVHCALALLELGRTLGLEVKAAYGHAGFNVRVGIHTGAVLLGGGVDGAGTVRGIAVNVAARMEQTAPAGGLRISHDTFCQVRGAFDVTPQPPLEVKGMSQPVVTYLVQRAEAARASGAEPRRRRPRDTDGRSEKELSPTAAWLPRHACRRRHAGAAYRRHRGGRCRHRQEPATRRIQELGVGKARRFHRSIRPRPAQRADSALQAAARHAR